MYGVGTLLIVNIKAVDCWISHPFFTVAVVAVVVFAAKKREAEVT